MIARLLICCAAALVATVALAQSGPTFSFKGAAGPYGVGLKVVDQYDESRIFRQITDELGRPYSGNRSRPLQTLIWYPADIRGGKPMTMGDYINLSRTETDSDSTKLSARAREWLTGLQAALNTPLWAVRNVREAQARFPVVIYVPSLSSFSWENLDLCEYLASHGYVVLASPSVGANTRAMTLDLEGIRTQARDVAFLIAYSQTLPNANTSQIAAMGFSWGGLGSFFAAAQDNRIDALIALDGSQRYYPALIKEGGVHPEEMTIPLLYFAQGEFSMEDQASYTTAGQFDGPNVLNAWTHGDLTTVRMLALLHGQFSSMFQRNEEYWRAYFIDLQKAKADYGREESLESYGWIARYTLAFLDTYLKRDAAAKAYLQNLPAENGVPKHLMAVNHRPASGMPASFESFRREIGRQGFTRVGEVLAAFQKQKPEFKPETDNLAAWAEQLLDDEHWAEAIALLKLAVELNPKSSVAHAGLARAYEQSGDRASALAHYHRALEANPYDLFAKSRLKALQD